MNNPVTITNGVYVITHKTQGVQAVIAADPTVPNERGYVRLYQISRCIHPPDKLVDDPNLSVTFCPIVQTVTPLMALLVPSWHLGLID